MVLLFIYCRFLWTTEDVLLVTVGNSGVRLQYTLITSKNTSDQTSEPIHNLTDQAGSQLVHKLPRGRPPSVSIRTSGRIKCLHVKIVTTGFSSTRLVIFYISLNFLWNCATMSFDFLEYPFQNIVKCNNASVYNRAGMGLVLTLTLLVYTVKHMHEI
jgi:hypothetical protein